MGRRCLRGHKAPSYTPTAMASVTKWNSTSRSTVSLPLGGTISDAYESTAERRERHRRGRQNHEISARFFSFQSSSRESQVLCVPWLFACGLDGTKKGAA